jgi:hypothetical protein
MKSLGIKRKDLYDGDNAVPICYPSLYLEPKYLTKMGLDEFEPGDRIKLEIEVVVRERTERKNEKGKETISQCLDLVASGTTEKAGTGEPEESDEEDEKDTSLGYERYKKKPRKISPKEALGD